MISTPNGQAAIVLGISDDPKQIYQLSWEGSELKWSYIGDLKTPRSGGSLIPESEGTFEIMWIPNELTDCTTPN